MLFRAGTLAFLSIFPAFNAGAQELRHSNLDPESAIFSAFPTLGGQSATPVLPPAAPRIERARSLSGSSVDDGAPIPHDLWDHLDTLKEYYGSNFPAAQKFFDYFFPGAKLDQMRVIDWVAADQIMLRSVNKKLFVIDIFTDQEFRNDHLFFIPQEVVKQIFEKYNMQIATTDHGTTTDNHPFVMCGLTIGQGTLNLLYRSPDIKNKGGEFAFVHPEMRYEFIVRETVKETIQGPGDLLVDGLKVKTDLVLHPKILRFLKVNGSTDPAHPAFRLDVYNSYESKPRQMPIAPLCIKNQPGCSLLSY